MTAQELQAIIENLLKTTGLQQDFEFVEHVQANRVQCEHLVVLHIESNIRCALNFTTHSVFHQSKQATEIIQKYMTLHPMCKFHSIDHHHLWSSHFDFLKKKLSCRQTIDCVHPCLAKCIERACIE